MLETFHLPYSYEIKITNKVPQHIIALQFIIL